MYASFVAKGEAFDELKEEFDEMKKENKKIKKSLKAKKKLIRNMKRLLGKDKSSKDDDEDDDYLMETQTETEPELHTNLPQVNPGDLIYDICKRRFPGTGSLKKHIDKMHKGKGKFKCPKCKKSVHNQKVAKGTVNLNTMEVKSLSNVIWLGVI